MLKQIPDNALKGSERMPELFIDTNTMDFPSAYLDDEKYAEAISTLVVVCADVIFVNKNSKSIFLAKRKAKPANDKWWVTGGRFLAGEEPTDAIKRIIKRETSLDIVDIGRLEYLGMYRYFFSNRQQIPQNISCDSLTYTFAYAINEDELAKISLDQDEYLNTDLTEFMSPEALNEAKVSKPIIDFYKKIFNLV